MSGLAIVLVLAGACTHASWNLAAKGQATTGPVFVWLSGLVSALVLTPVALVMIIRHPPSLASVMFGGAISGLIHTVYFLLLQLGYRSGDVSIVYPLARGTGPLLSVLGAVLIFGERPGPVGLIGAGVLIGGVLIISLAGSRGAEVRPSAVISGLATGVAIAGYTLWDSRAVSKVARGGLGLEPVVQQWASCLMLVLALTPIAAVRTHHTPDRLIGSARRILSRSGRAVFVVGVGSPLAYILILYAFRLAPVALVAPGRECSVVLVSLAGWLWLHEPNPRPRLVGAAVVLVGIVLLALA